MESKPFIEIGTIVKTRGLNGELILDPKIDELPEEIDILYLTSKTKQLTPLRLESYTFRKNKNRNSFFLKFEHVTDRTTAEKLVGNSVFISSDKLPEHVSEEDIDIISWPVKNGEQDFGTVADVFETPAHWVIEVHHESGSVIIPWVDEYIVSLDSENHVVHAQNLERFI